MATSPAEMAMEADADAMMADSLSYFWMPVVRLDVASANALDLPGRWTI